MYAKTQAEMRGYSLQSLKTFSGREGKGFSVTLVRDGIPWINCLNEGNGGSFRFEADTAPQRAKLDVLLADARLAEGEGMWDVPGEESLPCDSGGAMVADLFVRSLVRMHRTMESLECAAKTHTVWTHKCDKEGGVFYRSLEPYTPESVARLRAQMGANLGVIINEEIRLPPAPYDRVAAEERAAQRVAALAVALEHMRAPIERP